MIKVALLLLFLPCAFVAWLEHRAFARCADWYYRMIEQRRPTVAVDDPHVGERRDRRIDRDEGLEPRRSSEQRQQQHRRDHAAPWLTEDAA